MHTTETVKVADRLIDLLSEQRRLYLQLQELAQKQKELVNGDDPEMLLKVLAARQRLIDQLTALDRQLEPIRADWNRLAPSLSETQRQEVQRLVENVRQILGEILSRDEEDFEILSNQKQQVAGEIRSTTAGKRMHQAYTPAGTDQQSRYFDTKTG